VQELLELSACPEGYKNILPEMEGDIVEGRVKMLTIEWG